MGAQAQTVKNCIVLIALNNTGKFLMKIERSEQYESEVVKFLSHKKESHKTFTPEDEKDLLKETIALYFKSQLKPDSFEKINTLSIENIVFHFYKTFLTKQTRVDGPRIYFVDPKKLKGKTNSIEICKTPCLITDSVRGIVPHV